MVMVAAMKGRNECLELLIDAGADVNGTSYIGDTALILASFHGHENCVATLIRRGADVNAANANSQTSTRF